jgi:hypothetical protein
VISAFSVTGTIPSVDTSAMNGVPAQHNGGAGTPRTRQREVPMIEARGLVKHYRSVAASAPPGTWWRCSRPAWSAWRPGISFGLLCLYTVVTLGAGAVALARRDA